MKLPRGFLLAVGTVPFARLASAQATGVGRPSAIRDGLTRLAEDNISDGGIAEVHPIPPGDVQVGEALVKELEGDDQTTGKPPPPSRVSTLRWSGTLPVRIRDGCDAE